MFVALRAASRRRILVASTAAADESRGFPQRLDDIGAATSCASQPGSASKDILTGLVPIDGVDNRFQTVLDVPYRTTEGVPSVVGRDCEAIERWGEGRR